MLGIRQAPCMGSRRASTLPSSVYVGCCCFWNRCTSAKKRQRSSCSSRVAPKVYYTKVVVKYVFIHPGKPWKSQLLMNRILEAVIVCILCCHKLRVKNCRFMYNPRKLCTTGHWVHLLPLQCQTSMDNPLRNKFHWRSDRKRGKKKQAEKWRERKMWP